MAEESRITMLLVAPETELSPTCRVWGTGGWLPPEEREALDWLTLGRLLGWSVRVTPWTKSAPEASLPGGSRWVILACDPDCLGEELVALLTSMLAAEPILVVARAGAPGESLAHLAGAARRPERVTGQSLRWLGPGPERRWRCRKPLDASSLEASEEISTWATLNGAPLIVARSVGRGLVATLGFHPSRGRDADGGVSALLKHLLIWGAAAPVAWLDLEGSLILRMDDPGGAQNVHLRSWSYPKLGEAQWAAIGADLKRRNGRMSIGYIAGWVDDGDAGRGALEVAGRMPRRVPGQVYPSPLVKYQDRAGHGPGTLHDYEAEFRGIQALRAAGLGDVEPHGYTHMHPDALSWAVAPDRYEAQAWYRELGRGMEATIAARPPNEHPLALAIAALRGHFGARPTTLIAPGDRWTNDALERALDLGLHLVSSYYLALRDGERFCWTTHVCAPYLDEPDAAWFDAGLPVVGYFHDRDLVLEGVDWMSECVDRWQAAGARKLLDFRELAAALTLRYSLDHRREQLHLTVTRAGGPAPVRPISVGIRVPEGRIPSELPVLLDDQAFLVAVEVVGDALGRMTLPVHAEGG